MPKSFHRLLPTRSDRSLGWEHLIWQSAKCQPKAKVSPVVLPPKFGTRPAATSTARAWPSHRSTILPQPATVQQRGGTLSARPGNGERSERGSCDSCSIAPQQQGQCEQDQPEQYLCLSARRSFRQSKDRLVVLPFRQIRLHRMGNQCFVRWANRLRIHGHKTGVLADEMMRQRHIEHALPDCRVVLPMILLIHEGGDLL